MFCLQLSPAHQHVTLTTNLEGVYWDIQTKGVFVKTTWTPFSWTLVSFKVMTLSRSRLDASDASNLRQAL